MIEIPPLFWSYQGCPASVSTRFCLTRSSPTLGLRVCNAMYIACLLNGSCKSAASSGFCFTVGFHSSDFPPLYTRLLVISLYLSCFIISLSSLAKNTCCPVTITDRRRGNLLPAAERLIGANNPGKGVDATRICGFMRMGAAAAERLEV